MSSFQSIAARPTGLGSLPGTPGLPAGITDQFQDRIYDIAGVLIHAVTGGDGPAVLLVGGWPQFWWQWRHVMTGLAEHHTVVVADPRGFGLSGRPEHGYDAGTLATDMHSLMRGLGHQRFDVVGHDLGLMIGYAMAADDPAPICSLTMIDATLPGLSEGPTALPDDPEVVMRMWHMMFNRLDSVNEALVQGREEIYFADQFATKGATRDSLPAEAVALYVEMLRRPGALHACFQPYRALPTTMEQNRRRVAERLPMPVLAVGGAASYGDRITGVAQQVAENVTGVVIPDCGHYVPEEAPGPLLAALRHHLR